MIDGRNHPLSVRRRIMEFRLSLVYICSHVIICLEKMAMRP